MGNIIGKPAKVAGSFTKVDRGVQGENAVNATFIAEYPQTAKNQTSSIPQKAIKQPLPISNNSQPQNATIQPVALPLNKLPENHDNYFAAQKAADWIIHNQIETTGIGLVATTLGVINYKAQQTQKAFQQTVQTNLDKIQLSCHKMNQNMEKLVSLSDKNKQLQADLMNNLSEKSLELVDACKNLSTTLSGAKSVIDITNDSSSRFGSLSSIFTNGFRGQETLVASVGVQNLPVNNQNLVSVKPALYISFVLLLLLVVKPFILFFEFFTRNFKKK